MSKTELNTADSTGVSGLGAMKQALDALESLADYYYTERVKAAMSALRLAIEQAERQEPAPGYCKHCKQYTIEEPLPAPPKQEKQEPVAWKNAAMRLGEELSSVGPDGYYDMTAEQWLDWAMDQRPTGKQSLQVEPVAWWREDGSICTDERQAGDHDIPLYTHRRLIPRDYTAPPQRQPLTEEEMELLWSTTNRHEHFFGQHLDFARAIERKHGIGGGE